MQLQYYKQSQAQVDDTKSRQNNSIAIVAGAGALLALILIISGAVDQLEAAAIIGVIIAGLAVIQPQIAITFTFIYLALMGDIRRYIVTEAGIVSNDPLLTIGPLVAVTLLLTAAVKGKISLRSKTAQMVMLLCCVMGLEMLNPLQGGITVGVSGALFFVVPLLWFWVGHAFGSSEYLQKLLTRVVVPLAVVASLVGLMQAFFGYFHYQVQWFHLMVESAVKPDIRPFAFFCSWAEYAGYVAIGLLVVAVPIFQGRLRVSMIFIPLFVLALIIQSVREVIFETILALAVLWAVGGRSRVAIGGRLVLALLVGGALLVVAMTQLKDVEVSDEVKNSVKHTTDGVLDIGNSSAGVHMELVGDGFTGGITHPFGYGLGFPTMAGAAAGGFSSEIDFSDIFIACGVFGGILYFYIMFLIGRTSFLGWRDRRDPAALYTLAIITLGLGHWLSGAAYAVSTLIWFAIGSMDRAALDAAPALKIARRAVPQRRVYRPNRLTAAPRQA